MIHALLIQLPIPQINFGKQTGNITLAAACLKQSADALAGVRMDILPESVSSYLGDAALIRFILSVKPDVVGFTIYNWNLFRSIHLARRIRQSSQASIIFGGPEITSDHPVLQTDCVDFFVIGDGEIAFRQILKYFSGHGAFHGTDSGTKKRSKIIPGNHRSQAFAIHPRIIDGMADDNFRFRPSPYVNHLLDSHADGLMYLESQRGCVYRCGFCYYNKSRKNVTAADDGVVLEAVRWAVDHGVKEICMMDPSFNARPGLSRLLEKIAEINRNHMVSINGEIRAEFIDAQTADLFAAAGFTAFEIGLQSANPKALEIMNRKTDLRRFLQGTTLLKERGIIPRIDLIVGLPGDDLNGFRKTLMFVAENSLADDIQIFPLSVLPGTEFRLKSRELGLSHEAFPPYLIRKTPTYAPEDIYLSFDYAESLFDVSLFPAPFLDIAFKNNQHPVTGSDADDIWVHIQNQKYIKALVLTSQRSERGITAVSTKLTSPYQVFIGQAVRDAEFICNTLKIVTGANPFTPLELIFLEPGFTPDTRKLLSSVKLDRPNYLDSYNTYQYNTPGNRSVLFTLVSDKEDIFFQGDMKRQIFWWKKTFLPDAKDMEKLSELDGIFMDSPHSFNEILTWQNRMAPKADDMPYISFADIKFQKRWLRLTAADEFSGLFF